MIKLLVEGPTKLSHLPFQYGFLDKPLKSVLQSLADTGFAYLFPMEITLRICQFLSRGQDFILIFINPRLVLRLHHWFILVYYFFRLIPAMDTTARTSIPTNHISPKCLPNSGLDGKSDLEREFTPTLLFLLLSNFLMFRFYYRYTQFGGPVHRRPAEDIAFSVARFIQNNGSFVNYYMVSQFFFISQ